MSPLPAAARADAAANAAVAVAIATLHADRRSALAAGDAAAGLAAVPTRYAGPDGCMARKDEARKAARLVVKEGKAIEAARRAWAIALPEPTFEEAEPAEGPAGKGKPLPWLVGRGRAKFLHPDPRPGRATKGGEI